MTINLFFNLSIPINDCVMWSVVITSKWFRSTGKAWHWQVRFSPGVMVDLLHQKFWPAATTGVHVRVYECVPGFGCLRECVHVWASQDYLKVPAYGSEHSRKKKKYNISSYNIYERIRIFSVYWNSVHYWPLGLLIDCIPCSKLYCSNLHRMNLTRGRLCILSALSDLCCDVLTRPLTVPKFR